MIKAIRSLRATGENDTIQPMNSSLSRFEARIQRLIEQGTARLFSSQDTKSTLAASLIEAMQAEVRFGDGDNLVAPGVYSIHASPEHAASLKTNQAILDEIKAVLLQAAAQSGIQIPDNLILHVVPQEDLPAGEFRVRCSGAGENIAQTQSLRKVAEPAERQVPTGAFLIVGGTEIFPLNLPIVNIGRKSDNHLVIENPQVSRRHAQLRAISGHYHFFDLGSTGGSRINNTEVKTAVLSAGDVISLAGVPLIYGQDAAQVGFETQEFRPSENEAGENGGHPTA
ncbi:MAG: FHA domain-containing protein [Chloroflexi bacterium]|nr:FHA domain-containing protein [Chloroflexota bacterium]